MFVLNSKSDRIGIRKLTDGELDHVAGGQTSSPLLTEVIQTVATEFKLVNEVINTEEKTLVSDVNGLL
jgi:hypothetical protein